METKNKLTKKTRSKTYGMFGWWGKGGGLKGVEQSWLKIS